jgi:hypothetical protein
LYVMLFILKFIFSVDFIYVLLLLSKEQMIPCFLFVYEHELSLSLVLSIEIRPRQASYHLNYVPHPFFFFNFVFETGSLSTFAWAGPKLKILLLLPSE